MYINVINVTYTYIILRTIKPTYLMTVYYLRGAAPIGLYVVKLKALPIPSLRSREIATFSYKYQKFMARVDMSCDRCNCYYE